MAEPNTISTEARKQAGLVLAGSIALVVICAALLGYDYSETRQRASIVPLNSQRITSVETALRSAAKDQADATKDLAAAVADLRVAIAEMRGGSK